MLLYISDGDGDCAEVTLSGRAVWKSFEDEMDDAYAQSWHSATCAASIYTVPLYLRNRVNARVLVLAIFEHKDCLPIKFLEK